jgi:predicted DNA-binding protein
VRESSALPRTLEARLAAVARKLGKPRRVVLKEALEEYAARHDQAAMVAAMNRVAQAVDTRLDADLASAGSRILERTEW